MAMTFEDLTVAIPSVLQKMRQERQQCFQQYLVLDRQVKKFQRECKHNELRTEEETSFGLRENIKVTNHICCACGKMVKQINEWL